MTFSRNGNETSSRLLPPDDIVASREYHCVRHSPGVYHVHAYQQGEYVGTYTVYRDEASSEFLCTCAKFLLGFPNVDATCTHINRVKLFTRGGSA